MNRLLGMKLNNLFERVYVIFFKADSEKAYKLEDWITVYDYRCFPSVFSRLGLKILDVILAEMIFILRVCLLVKRERINVITADNPYIIGFSALLVSLLMRVPFILYIVADYDIFYKKGGRRNIPFLPRWIEKLLEYKIFGAADRIIADRQYYFNYALRNGADPKKCFRVRTCTDHFYFSAKPQKDMRKLMGLDGNKVLFYFGRLHKEKLPHHLLHCIKIVRSKIPETVLLIAGSGPMENELKNLAADMNLGDAVYFLGVKGAQELVDLMNSSDVLLAIHAGYALIEMALSGKPIVAYDYEWHPELIFNNETGILVQYENYHGLADAVMFILTNPNIAENIGEKARERALQNHHPDDSIEDERKIYEELFMEQLC